MQGKTHGIIPSLTPLKYKYTDIYFEDFVYEKPPEGEIIL